MAIADDFNVTYNSGTESYTIDHVAGTDVYSALDIHAWLQDLADNESDIGDDEMSILKVNPSEVAGKRRADIPMAVTLLNNVSITDEASKFINFGSVAQNDNNDLFSGLKTIGGIVDASPIYVVQDGAKVAKFWEDGHIQVMLKARDAGALIDSGDVHVFSRKYGQTYSDFKVNLAAGGETAAALATAVDGNISMAIADAQNLSGEVTITFGDVIKDLNNGSGPKLYKCTISLSGGATLLDAYHYLQYICSEESTETINGLEGWRYQAVDDSYTPISASPFGTYAGGKMFFARGIWLEGVLSEEAKNYELISHTGETQVPPNLVYISSTGQEVGDRLLIGRDNGSGGFLEEEYTIQVAINGANSLLLNEFIKPDTPNQGTIRLQVGTGNNYHRYEYSEYDPDAKTFTLTTPLAQDYNGFAWVPFVDEEVTDTNIQTGFLFQSAFTARGRIRNGSAPLIPFETTFPVTASGGTFGAIRNLDA